MNTVLCPECRQKPEFPNFECKSCGPSETLQAWLEAAEKYLELEQYGNAEKFYRIALEKLGERYGPEHPDIAMSLYGLARLRSLGGDPEEAETLYRRALDAMEKILPGHPRAGKIAGGFGEHYLRQKNYPRAEELLRRAFAIQEKSLGRSHPETKSTRRKLSGASGEAKRAKTAKKPARGGPGK